MQPIKPVMEMMLRDSQRSEVLPRESLKKMAQERPITREEMKAEAVPSSVIPPDRPLGTGVRVLMETGGLLLRRPSSPAKVSLVASEMEAPNRTRAESFPVQYHMRAPRVAIRPLARTCIASRFEPFFSMVSSPEDCFLMRLERRPTTLQPTKKSSSKRKPSHLVHQSTITPITTAAMAPERSKALLFRAITPIKAIIPTIKTKDQGHFKENNKLSRYAII